jgi:hypothetical protein
VKLQAASDSEGLESFQPSHGIFMIRQNGHVAHLFEMVRPDSRRENSSNGHKRSRTSESIMRTINVRDCSPG